MTPRNRKAENEGLPDNLYFYGGYYKYRSPITKVSVGLGADKKHAFEKAKYYNAQVLLKIDALSKVIGGDKTTWADLVFRFRAERQNIIGNKESTITEENYRLDHIANDLGSAKLTSSTQKLISGWLSSNYSGNGYTKHRGTLIKLMAFGIASGMFPDGFPNLAASTLPAPPSNKVRKVLTLEQFYSVRDCASDWLKVAMDIGLITLQRRGDLVGMKYTDIEGDRLKVITSKTERHGDRAFLKIKIGKDLAEAISQSRRLPPVSPFLIHRAPRIKKEFEGQEHWAQVRDQELTKEFRRARDATGLFNDCGTGEAPTFAEIRVLGSSVYIAQGYPKEYVNLLMGHTTQRMTDSYIGQQTNWTECAAELNLRG